MSIYLLKKIKRSKCISKTIDLGYTCKFTLPRVSPSCGYTNWRTNTGLYEDNSDIRLTW